jgi:uncharacterized membrane protein YfcA
MSILIGLLSGMFGGLVGLGGGVIMIPLMVGIMKLRQHRAHGTSLVALVFTGISGTVTYALQGSVDFMAAALLSVTAMVTVRTGARFAHSLPEWKLKRSFGAFLVVVSVMMVLKPYLPHASSPAEGIIKIVVLLATGALSGIASGMMGVGGGTVMVPAMVFLVGMTQHTAQGSSLLAMIPAGAAGAWTHNTLGNVEKKLLTGLIPGILLGTYIGGSVAHFLPDSTLRLVFAALLIWTGLRFLRSPAGTRPGRSVNSAIVR